MCELRCRCVSCPRLRAHHTSTCAPHCVRITLPTDHTITLPRTHSLGPPQGYVKGHDFSYWVPLEFDSAGAVQQFEPFVDSWTLALPPAAARQAG